VISGGALVRSELFEVDGDVLDAVLDAHPFADASLCRAGGSNIAAVVGALASRRRAIRYGQSSGAAVALPFRDALLPRFAL
jgi:hypothetical protein